MSEATEQAQDLRELLKALLDSQQALQAAEQAAKSYGKSLADGSAKLDVAKAAEVEAARIIAQANAAKAEARFRAEADGSAAAARAAEAAKQAAEIEKKASAEAARAAVEASKEKERAARAEKSARDEAAAKSQQVRGAAIGALGGEETVEKYNKMREAAKLAGDSSLTMGQRVTAGAAAMRFAAGTAMALGTAAIQAGGDLMQFVQGARQAEASLAAYDQRMHAVSGSLAAMRAATAGAVDTQVAFNLQLALSEQGIRATEQQEAALARAIREHANARQISQEQASAVVQRAIAGDAAAATSLGLSLSNTTTTAERYTAVLRQLEQQQRGNAVAGETAAEAARRNEQETDRATQKVQASVGWLLRHAPATWAIRTAIEAHTRSQEENSAVTDEAGQALARQTMEQERSARAAQRLQSLERARLDDARRATAIQQSAAVQELQYLDEWVVGLGEVISAEAQVQQARQAAREFTARDGDSEAQTNERRIQAANALAAALRRKNAEEQRRDGIRNAEAQIGLAAHQARLLGMHVDARIRSITPAQRLAQLQRELADFAKREGESIDQTLARRQQILNEATAMFQRTQQEAGEARERAEAMREYRNLSQEAADHGWKIVRVTREAGESQIQYLQRRRDLQRELNEALTEEHDLTEQQQRLLAQIADSVRKREEDERQAEDAMRDRNIAMGEADHQRRVALMEQERDLNQRQSERAQQARDASDLQTQLRQTYGFAEELSQSATQRMVESAKSGTDALAELGRGTVEAIAQAGAEGKDAGAAVAAYVDQWATAKAIQWGMQSAESFAGAGLAYFIRPDAMPGLLASGATYAGLALAAGGVAVAIPNAPAASTSSGGGSSSPGLAASSRADAAGPAAAPNIVFNISGVMANEQTQEVLARGIRDAYDRGLLDMTGR